MVELREALLAAAPWTLSISSTSSSSSPSIIKRALPSPSLPPVCLKKTRFVPDLSICDCCGLRFPSPSSQSGASGGRLVLLRSQWRVALLCAPCLARVSSAELCFYCFSPFSDPPAHADLDCFACSRRVHVACARREHRRAASDAAFTCIDCCVIPKIANSRTAKSHDAKPDSWEDVVRDARANADKKAKVAAKAREHALTKAEAAKHAAERAQKTLGDVLIAGKAIRKRDHRDATTVARDEELALQLHLAMNGSRRISRRATAGSLVKPKKVPDGLMLGKVQFCREHKSFDSVEGTNFAQNLFAELDTCANEHKAVDDNGKDGIFCVPLKEEDMSYSVREMTLNSNHDESKRKLLSLYHKKQKKMDDVVYPEQCARNPGEEYTMLQEKDISTITDRYIKKYGKRFKVQSWMDEHQSHRVPHQQIVCPEASAA